MNEKPSCVVLLSGGIDSAVTAAVAKRKGYSLHCLTFDYGQKDRSEIDCAAKIAESLEAVEHRILAIELDKIGGSALTSDIDVPADSEDRTGIPVTYVPARNIIFLSFALSQAEVIDSRDIFIGVNCLDYSGYPDCRPEFIEAFEKTAAAGTKTGVEEDSEFDIHTPLIDMRKHEIINLGDELGVNFGLTHSCYDPSESGLACGECESCAIRLRGFDRSVLEDPVDYQC